MGARRNRVRELRESVVKVMTVADPPDYDQPWQTVGATSATGSGAVVETPGGLRILTNAHVVEDATFIEVRRYGQPDKVVAEVAGYGETCDLALLSVENRRFFENARPLPIGPLPRLGDPVTVLGFPIGGERLSITEGVLSRVELTTYAQSERSLLGMQIDAAINSGNSGGPVLMDGKLVGIAFQTLEEAENVGYVIPSPVVEHFLQDVANPPYGGFPDLGITVQTLESVAHRRSLGLPRSRRGVLLTHVHYQGSCWGVLQPGDVLLAVDDQPIASDGLVPFGKGSRIEFAHVAATRHVGETIPLKVWRGGRRVTCPVVLRREQPLVPGRAPGGRPTWFLYAGLLFVPLTRAWLQTWGDNWRANAPAGLVALYDLGVRTSRSLEVVVLQKVLADAANRGYHDLESLRIRKVQGRRVRCLRDLVRTVDATEEPFVEFEASDRRRIVVEREVAEQRARHIQKRYGVPRGRSADLPRKRRPSTHRPSSGRAD